ncbi:hypothetical protein VPH35_122597 [Triticum aestivum]
MYRNRSPGPKRSHHLYCSRVAASRDTSAEATTATAETGERPAAAPVSGAGAGADEGAEEGAMTPCADADARKTEATAMARSSTAARGAITPLLSGEAGEESWRALLEAWRRRRD